MSLFVKLSGRQCRRVARRSTTTPVVPLNMCVPTRSTAACHRKPSADSRSVLGRIHGAIVAATRAIVAAIAPCIHYRRSSPRLSPVRCLTKQVFVAASIAPTVVATIAPCIRPVSIYHDVTVQPHFSREGSRPTCIS